MISFSLTSLVSFRLWSPLISACKMSSSDNIFKDLKIEYPPPYSCEIQNYNKAETDLISHSIENVDWSNLCLGKNVRDQVEICNQTIRKIFHKFVPNKTILCDDQDLPRMNEKIKSLIKKKSAFYCSRRKSINCEYTTLDAMALVLLGHLGKRYKYFKSKIILTSCN